MLSPRGVWVVPLCLGTAVVGVAGCTRKTAVTVAPVSGTITYHQQPIDHGQIVMVHGSGRMAVGQVRADGTYLVQAPIGENKVMIQCLDELDLSQIRPKENRPESTPRSFIPNRYTNYATSQLHLNVIDGENTQDWELVD